MADTSQQQTGTGINDESERKAKKGARRKVACPLYHIRNCLMLMPLVVLMLTFSGCEKIERLKQNEIAASFKRIDSGIWTYPGSSEKTYWLDNERVLMISNKTLAPTLSPEPKFMTIWNVKTGQINLSHELTTLFCAQDDIVFFGHQGKHYRGPLESPQEHIPPDKNVRMDEDFDCDWAPMFNRANVPYKIKLKNNNYLEILKESTLTKELKPSLGESRYYESLVSPPVPLPVHVDLFGPYSIRFNQLRNAYFISPGMYAPKDSYYDSMWWLQRDGKLTHEPFPKNHPLRSQGGLRIHPLRDGYLVDYSGGGTNSMTNTGARGLYLIQGDNMQKILLGAIHAVSVSPDGCRTAFSYAKNTKEDVSRTKPYRTMQSINFCDGRIDQ